MNTHEFGGNGFDEPQIGLPGNRHLDRVIQESGLVMNLAVFGSKQTEEEARAEVTEDRVEVTKVDMRKKENKPSAEDKASMEAIMDSIVGTDG